MLCVDFFEVRARIKHLIEKHDDATIYSEYGLIDLARKYEGRYIEENSKSVGLMMLLRDIEAMVKDCGCSRCL